MLRDEQVPPEESLKEVVLRHGLEGEVGPDFP
jgi:hypothetical protein